MADFLSLPLPELAARMARRELSAETMARACIERIEASESWVRAWQYFEPSQVIEQARRLDTQAAGGPLHGIPLGVKDLMDTADMPTSYGSPIYRGHRPAADAACVGASRAAGAVIMGKTVTTEFATFQPGPTRNPRSKDTPRTPGGSSSGSAAAVAAGMVPLAFGTQTAGSVIRPAAYCGVVGYKPTFGTLPVTGVKIISPSLDTVGVFARSVADAGFLVGTLARLPLRPPPDHAPHPALRVGICRTEHWFRASEDTRNALYEAAKLLEKTGAAVSDAVLPAACRSLAELQRLIMEYEIAAAFSAEAQAHPEGFSPAFSALLQAGSAVGGDAYFTAQAQAQAARNAMQRVFDSVDILLAPSTEGEAPEGLSSTGDPVFNRMWTLLGNPCVHVPTGTGANGMPVGVTVIGPRWQDARALAAAQLLEKHAG